MPLRSLVLSVVAGALLCACAAESGDSPEASTTITGALTYRERIALPPDASARITLSDVSVADRPAQLLVENILDLSTRQVPIPFLLTVDRARLEARGRYAVRGTIHDGEGNQLWTTDNSHLIDPASADNDLGILMMVHVPRTLEVGIRRLSGGEWVVEDIAGRGIIDSSRATLIFGEDGQLSGRASCNSYSASYKAESDRLTIGQAITTLRACAPALDNQEQEFLRILSEVEQFRFSDSDALILESAAGETITARLQ